MQIEYNDIMNKPNQVEVDLLTRRDVLRMHDIADEIMALVNEARRISTRHFKHSNAGDRFEAYVFRQIEEHCEKGNPYNQDLHDVASEIETGGESEEE